MGITLTYPKIARFAPSNAVDWIWRNRGDRDSDGENRDAEDMVFSDFASTELGDVDANARTESSLAGEISVLSTLLLRVYKDSDHAIEEYLSGRPCNKDGDHAAANGDLQQSSLLTFHGLGGVAYNRDQVTSTLRYVNNKDHVTVYANVHDGRYLSPESDTVQVSHSRSSRH